MVLILIQAIIFGIKKEDRQWVPRPDQNYLSWAYGFFIISAFFTLFSAITLVLASRDFKRKLKQDYPDRRYWETHRQNRHCMLSQLCKKKEFINSFVWVVYQSIFIIFLKCLEDQLSFMYNFYTAWIQKNFFRDLHKQFMKKKAESKNY